MIFCALIGICWIGLGDALTIIWPCLARKREPIYRLVSLAKEEGPWRNVTFKPLRRADGPTCPCRLGRGCSTRRAACGGRPGSYEHAARDRKAVSRERGWQYGLIVEVRV